MKPLPAPVPGGVTGEVEPQDPPRGRGSEHFPGDLFANVSRAAKIRRRPQAEAGNLSASHALNLTLRHYPAGDFIRNNRGVGFQQVFSQLDWPWDVL